MLYRMAFRVGVNMALFTRPAHIPEVVEACLTYSTRLAAFQNPNNTNIQQLKAILNYFKANVAVLLCICTGRYPTC